MIAEELITDSIPPVKPTDPASLTLDWMGEFKLGQLPIVQDRQYLGIVRESDILDAADPDVPVSEIRYAGFDGAYVMPHSHFYEIVDVMTAFNLEVLPVLDEEKRYLGMITLRDLLQFLRVLFAVSDPGGVLVLEIPPRSYMLSEVGRIAESADAKVLSLYLAQTPGTDTFLLTLKLNVEDLSRLIAAFERFDYKVIRAYHRARFADNYDRNLQALLRWLEM